VVSLSFYDGVCSPVGRGEIRNQVEVAGETQCNPDPAAGNADNSKEARDRDGIIDLYQLKKKRQRRKRMHSRGRVEGNVVKLR
jgi:hypothetical protein